MATRSPLVGAFLRVGTRLVDPLISHPRLTRLIGMEPIRVRYTGPKSGRVFDFPAWAKAADDGVVITVGAPSQKTWWRNYRRQRPIEVKVADAPWRSGTALVHEPKPGAVQVRVTWA